MGQKIRGRVWSPSNKVPWAEAYLHAKYHLDPSSHLATINMGGKFVGASHVTQCK